MSAPGEPIRCEHGRGPFDQCAECDADPSDDNTAEGQAVIRPISGDPVPPPGMEHVGWWHAGSGFLVKAYPAGLAERAEYRDEPIRPVFAPRLDTIRISGEHRQVETPNWSTKIRCSCGAEFTSRAEFSFHQAPALQAEVERMRSRLAAAERVCEAAERWERGLPHSDLHARLREWRAVRDGDQ